jgi:hypothetical protein
MWPEERGEEERGTKVGSLLHLFQKTFNTFCHNLNKRWLEVLFLVGHIQIKNRKSN